MRWQIVVFVVFPVTFECLGLRTAQRFSNLRKISSGIGGYETVTYLNIFLFKRKANIHAVILNHFIGHKDIVWFTDSRVSHAHIFLPIYFYMVDWLASQWVSSHCYDLPSGFSWSPGRWLSIPQKNISKFQRFRNRSSTYFKKITILTHLTDSRVSESVRIGMTWKVVQNDGIVHGFKMTVLFWPHNYM